MTPFFFTLFDMHFSTLLWNLSTDLCSFKCDSSSICTLGKSLPYAAFSICVCLFPTQKIKIKEKPQIIYSKIRNQIKEKNKIYQFGPDPFGALAKEAEMLVGLEETGFQGRA